MEKCKNKDIKPTKPKLLATIKYWLWGILNKGNLVALDTTQKLLEKIQIKKISIKVNNRVNINENKFKTLKIVSSTNDEINLSYDKNELKIDQIIKLIEENGARILDLSTDDGDLEDVFLSLTKS